MSAPRPLPDRPDLHQLKIQAKELLHAHRTGVAAVADRLRASLPELSEKTDEEILNLKFALLDAQRALASEYGFATWGEMARHVESVRNGRFEDLFQYDHGTTYLISHEADPHDLAIVLAGLSGEQRNVFTFNMPEQMLAEIEADTSAEEASPAAVVAAQDRILEEVRRLAAEGQLAWPPWAKRQPQMSGKTNRASVELLERLRVTTEASLADCSYEEIGDLMADLGQLGRLMGILHLKQLLKGVGDPFLRTGLGMALDGAEPDRVTETLENHMRTLLHEQEVRYRKVIAGMRSVQKGDNPVYVKGTLELIR
ncbi:MAG: hypothetical protein HN712_13265 [Gemmatimonadetes bacterium]|jgi:hypothetical protein|nr:hypothetical protein [Gemmatimonadota bacterium]MBT6147314.1 hypothetical protein [Gemmatimonadota bacterium]MBT7861284.1 hypothetical protein [Gemmatimonadota bacterium]